MKIRHLWLTAAVVLAAAVVAPTTASAHVTVQPKAVPADSYTRIEVRVPNEDDKAATTKVEVSFPAGIYATSYEPVPGWKVSVKLRKLDAPVQAGHGTTETETDVVTFTATGDGIEPGQFQDFGLSIRTPSKPGELKFPAVQTYSNGDVVRWIGEPDSDHPAATVNVEAAADQHGVDAEAADGGGSDTSTVAWIALVLGALGLLLGGSALASARRRV